MSTDRLKQYFEKVLKIRQTIEGSGLENNLVTDIYTATDKLDSFLKECVSNIKNEDLGLATFYSGIRYIELIKEEELKALPHYKTQRDKRQTFNSVKEKLLYHIKRHHQRP